MASTRYLLALNAAIVTLYGYQSSNINAAWRTLLLSFIGIAISVFWHRIDKSHRNLDTVKLTMFHQLEKQLPASIHISAVRRGKKEMAGLVRGAKALLDCSAHPACFLSMEILQNKSYPNATNNPMLKDLLERQVFVPAAEESILEKCIDQQGLSTIMLSNFGLISCASLMIHSGRFLNVLSSVFMSLTSQFLRQCKCNIRTRIETDSMRVSMLMSIDSIISSIRIAHICLALDVEGPGFHASTQSSTGVHDFDQNQ